jgi:hypothetical protein
MSCNGDIFSKMEQHLVVFETRSPRSRDLTLSDFYLWHFLKNIIYSTPVNNLDDLRQRIIDKREQIKTHHMYLLQNVINKKTESECHKEGGGYFQHLL